MAVSEPALAVAVCHHIPVHTPIMSARHLCHTTPEPPPPLPPRRCKCGGCTCRAFFYIVAQGAWILRCRCVRCQCVRGHAAALPAVTQLHCCVHACSTPNVYMPAATCSCKHKHTEHDPGSRACTKRNCTCAAFDRWASELPNCLVLLCCPLMCRAEHAPPCCGSHHAMQPICLQLRPWLGGAQADGGGRGAQQHWQHAGGGSSGRA